MHFLINLYPSVAIWVAEIFFFIISFNKNLQYEVIKMYIKKRFISQKISIYNTFVVIVLRKHCIYGDDYVLQSWKTIWQKVKKNQGKSETFLYSRWMLDCAFIQRLGSAVIQKFLEVLNYKFFATLNPIRNIGLSF